MHEGVSTFRKFGGSRAGRVVVACTVAFSLSATVAPQERPPERGPPKPLFTAPLADAPGKNLVVVELNFAPNPDPPSTAEHHRRGHHHPGSVFVYVTQGAVRLGIEGQPVQVVNSGGVFFEPVGAHHIVTENASATEPARAIAVMVVPEGAPLTTPDEE